MIDQSIRYKRKPSFNTLIKNGIDPKFICIWHLEFENKEIDIWVINSNKQATKVSWCSVNLQL